MAPQHADDEAGIRRRIGELVEAVRAMDLDGVKLAYAPDMVSFDNRVTGTLKNWNSADYWVRWTACFRKIDGNWLIAHDHVSVPLDVASGRALLDLKP
jgi:ketosteroid isomerase-like protein